MPILLNKTIRLFLDSIGRREEYEFYLDKFHSDQTTCFAILCLERAGFEEAASVFTFDMRFLLQVELFPDVLVCGAGAGEMRALLCRGEHPYAVKEIAPSFELKDVLEFLAACRSENRVGLLLAPDVSPGQVLPRLLPDAARRVHFIRQRGALRDAADRPLFFYYTVRPNEAEVAEPDRPLAALAARLLEQRPGTHLSVTSPWKLLQELFTVKGAGCVVRRGSLIRRVSAPAQLDQDRLAALLEESFGRPLRSREALSRVNEAYVEEQYRGAALLERHPDGMYLSKFAVGTEARGEGLAGELWADIVRDHPRLFWRARPDNPINHWYERHAEGHHQAGAWVVFWRGVDPSCLARIITYSLSRPDDFGCA